MCECPHTCDSSVLNKELEALGIHGNFPGLPPVAGVRSCFLPPNLPSVTGRAKYLKLCLSGLLGSVLMSVLLAFHLGDWHQLPVCEHMSPLSNLPPKREPQQCVPRAPSLFFHPSQGLLAWCCRGVGGMRWESPDSSLLDSACPVAGWEQGVVF